MAGRRVGLIALAVSVALTAGCSRGDGAAAAGRTASSGADHSYASDRSADRSGQGYGSSDGEREDRGPVPMFHGEPMWSETRSHTAKEGAEHTFERAGGDLGSKTLDDFLTKVHRFGDHPPTGTLKLVRANGDRLLYDPKSNLFAVFTRDGAPRTVFKPNEGMAYWTEQKAREEARAGDDSGGYGGGRSRGGYGGGRYGHGGGSGDQGQ